jgi:hypothetical protein
VLEDADASAALADAEREVKRALGELSHDQRMDEALVAEALRLTVRRVLARAAGYKPEVVVTLVRVAKAADRVLPQSV